MLNGVNELLPALSVHTKLHYMHNKVLNKFFFSFVEIEKNFIEILMIVNLCVNNVIKQALLGAQLVMTLIMVSVIQKLSPHYSLAKWILCSTGLIRFLHPTDNELKTLAGMYSN